MTIHDPLPTDASLKKLEDGLSEAISTIPPDHVVDGGLRADLVQNWLISPLPIVASLGEQDKFAHLVEIARKSPTCSDFLLEDVDLDPSTAWRWSTGKKRPTKYVAQKVAGDILQLLTDLLREPISTARSSALNP